MTKALFEKHINAIELRKKGWSYSAIKNELHVSKSSLSLWLRQYPLSHRQLDKLLFHNEKRIEHFRATMARKKKEAFDRSFIQQGQYIQELSVRELYLCGLALYWGEGGKTKYAELSFSNTDARMIRFFLMWLKKCIKFPLDKIRVRLHLYRDMIEEAEIMYWMKELDLSRDHFRKTYIKSTTLKGLTYKSRGHGTCNIIAPGLEYSRPAMAGMEFMARIY